MAEEIDVGMKCIKYMLFVANFMFVMIGFLLISIGCTIKAIYGDFEEFMANHYFHPAVLAIVIGVIIFFVAILGCVGAVKESTCLINLFGFFLTVLLIMEVAAAIAAYAMRSQIETTVRENMRDSFDGYANYKGARDLWDFTQRRLGCCGIDQSSDWDNLISSPAPTYSSTSSIIANGIGDSSNTVNSSILVPAEALWLGPSSCCRRRTINPSGSCLKTQIYQTGCVEELSYIVSESALLLGCGALAVAFIQMLGIIFAWMLAKAVRRLKSQDLVEREQNRQRIYEQLARGKDTDSVPTPVLYTPTFSEA